MMKRLLRHLGIDPRVSKAPQDRPFEFAFQRPYIHSSMGIVVIPFAPEDIMTLGERAYLIEAVRKRDIRVLSEGLDKGRPCLDYLPLLRHKQLLTGESMFFYILSNKIPVRDLDEVILDGFMADAILVSETAVDITNDFYQRVFKE